MANEGQGETRDREERQRISERVGRMEESDGRGGEEEKPERRYRTLPKGGKGEREAGPRGGGEYEGDPDEEWKEERARGERGRAVKAGG